MIFLVIEVSNMSLGLQLKLVEEGFFTCTLSSPSLQVVLKINFFVRTFYSPAQGMWLISSASTLQVLHSHLRLCNLNTAPAIGEFLSLKILHLAAVLWFASAWLLRVKGTELLQAAV